MFENIKFESGRLTTAQEIMAAMIQRLGLPLESDQIFSLWLTSKHLRKTRVSSGIVGGGVAF